MTKDKWFEEIRLSESWHKGFYQNSHEAERVFTNSSRDDESYFKTLTYPVYWSSLETLKPAIFSGIPQVFVSRRRDQKNPISKVASIILENCLKYCLDQPGISQAFSRARDDYLLTGRGQTWVRYDAKGGNSDSLVESVVLDSIHWKDFIYNPSRDFSKSEIRWVARKSYLTEKQIKNRFGNIEFSPDYLPSNVIDQGESYLKSEQSKHFLRQTIYEIWDKESEKVIWLSTSLNKILDEDDPPIAFEDFFPCPIPIVQSVGSSSSLPLSDFVQVREHLRELDEIVQKQKSIRKSLKIAGVYDSSLDGIQRLLSENRDFALVPVENWVRFSQSGGFSGGIDWLPLEQSIGVLQQLQAMEQQTLSRIYEITAYTDLMRGASNPQETATAQTSKVNFTNVRLNNKVKNFAIFVRDSIKLMGEVVSELFSDESLYRIGGVSDLGQEDQMMFSDAIRLLRQDYPREWELYIETSDTALVDEREEKAEASEFITSLNALIQGLAPTMQSFPMLAPVFGETVKWSVRKFRAGRNFETQIDQSIDRLIETTEASLNQPPAPPAPDPQMIKAQGQLQIEQQRLQLEHQKMQSDIALEREKMQSELILIREKHIRDLEVEREKIRAKFELEQGHQMQTAQLKIEEIRAETESKIQAIRAESQVEYEKMRMEHDATLRALKDELREKYVISGI
jgi:hypothetical protein